MISLFKKLWKIPLIVMLGSFMFMKFAINDFIFQPDTVLTWVLSCLVASIIVMFSSFVLLMKTRDNKFYLVTVLGALFVQQMSFTLERWGIIASQWEILVPLFVSLVVSLIVGSLTTTMHSTAKEEKAGKQG